MSCIPILLGNFPIKLAITLISELHSTLKIASNIQVTFHNKIANIPYCY